MPSVELSLVGTDGGLSGELAISALPGQEHWNGIPQVLDRRGVAGGPTIEAPVQLLEECEYSYVVAAREPAVIVEPRELFDPSDSSGTTGRLRTRRSTGTVEVVVEDQTGALLGTCEIEVRARKLEYLSEYRWMLTRIAEEAAEILQSRFAASSLGVFRPDRAGTAETLYQQFAFLQAYLESEEFQDALQLILNRPDQEYRAVTRERSPGQGLRASSTLIRQLVAPGPRQPSETRISGDELRTLPRVVFESYTAETLDTLPNRFVKFALEQWRDLAEDVETRMARVESSAGRRGCREAKALRHSLEAVLRAPLFHEVGRLETFPSSNTVIQRRSGYRDVLRAFLQAEAAAVVDWSGAETVFRAGQRDVAALYEYWVFLELLRIVMSCSGFQVDRKPLLRLSGDRLSLDLRSGRSVVLHAYGVRRGRAVELELWFNRQFRRRTETWSEPMRPDCSLRISPAGRATFDASTWLHFDAKYRIGSYTEIFEDDAESPGSLEGNESAPVVDDLLKMHAYRDAIRRTSGAYVLYPGTDRRSLRRREYHEILPGLGAFVLRPTVNGRADDTSMQSLRQFIEDVIDHVASQGTDQQRADYWTHRTYAEHLGRRLVSSADLTKPPADTKVLLGYLRNDDHWAWVERTGLYNLRADGRRGTVGLDSPELASDFICLYTADQDDVLLFRLEGTFVLKTGAELVALRYPNPRGELYCCVVLGERVEARGVEMSQVRRLARRGLAADAWGTPRAVTWSELFAS